MVWMAQKPILKMEISDNYVFSQALVGVGKFRICLIEVGPFRGLVAATIENCGEFSDWSSAKAINNSVGTSYFIVDVEVELL